MKSIVLHNAYLCMRHAQSTANKEHIIASNPKTGINKYGLTQKGEQQVLQALVIDKKFLSVEYVYTSDFLRAYQTAMIISQQLNNVPVKTDARLRERYFGQFDGTNSENYHRIWNMDCKLEFDVSCYDVEPIYAVAKRMLSFLLNCENNHINQNILVVSHGDPLQILYTIACGFSAHQFRSLPHFSNAEVRLLPSYFTIPEEYVS